MAGNIPSAVLGEIEIDDLFTQALQRESGDRRRNATDSTVRRPLRGLQIKTETFATLSVAGPGRRSTLLNSSSPEDSRPGHTSNFILQSVSETRMEKFQAISTFGAPYGFFFGEQPRMVQFQAILLNTADFQWTVEWWDNYEQHLRGTQLTAAGMRAYMAYDDVVLEGYLTQASTATSASQPYEVQLSFAMWVTNVDYLVTPGQRRINSRHQSSRSRRRGSVSLIEASREEIQASPDLQADNLRQRAQGQQGLLSFLRNSLRDVAEGQFVGGVAGRAVDSAVNFLYGRNLVIPAGFAGSERTAGEASFASQNLVVPPTVSGIPRVPSRDVFYDNADEYPARSGTESSETTLPEIGGSTRDEQDLMYTALAEEVFASFNYDITNEQGLPATDTLRAIGRMTNGALSFADMTSGLSQDAAALTANPVASAIAEADQEQALLEETRP